MVQGFAGWICSSRGKRPVDGAYLRQLAACAVKKRQARRYESSQQLRNAAERRGLPEADGRAERLIGTDDRAPWHVQLAPTMLSWLDTKGAGFQSNFAPLLSTPGTVSQRPTSFTLPTPPHTVAQVHWRRHGVQHWLHCRARGHFLATAAAGRCLPHHGH